MEKNPTDERGTTRRGVVVTRAADIKPRKLVGVWNGRFHRGKLGLIAGEPGLGKSQVGILMAATVSTGGEWPCGEGTARRGDVVYISAEDRATDTIRPRLEAAGADLARVHIIEEVNHALGARPFSLVTDLGQLDEVLKTLRKPRLVIIDPINACLSSADIPFNPNSVTHVRGLFCRLESVAAQRGVAIVCVTHFTKAKGATILARVTGSFAFVAAARSVFTVERKQDDPNQRVFAAAKNNLTADTDPLVFRIEQGASEIPAPYAFRREYLSAASPVFASRPDWTRVSIIPSAFAIPVGQLSSVDLEKIVKHARKRLERSPHLRDRIVIGGIDVSLNQQNNSVGHWQLHLYLLIEGKKTSKFTAAVKAAFPPEPTAARPYRFRAVDDFAAAASYAYKSIFKRRSAYLKDGKPRTRALPLKRQDEVELLSWLGGYKAGARLILRGVRRNGSPLQLQPSKAVP
jgi:hypothetical protein